MGLTAAYDSWRVAVSDENATAVYEIQDWLELSQRGTGAARQPAQARAVVEVHKFTGGKSQRAMIGGDIRLGGPAARTIRVGQSSGLTLGAAATCHSELARPLVPGLPPEFARAALSGIFRVHADWSPALLITVDRAAYDEVDSSEFAFEFAGRLLLATLLQAIAGSLVARTLTDRHARPRSRPMPAAFSGNS